MHVQKLSRLKHCYAFDQYLLFALAAIGNNDSNTGAGAIAGGVSTSIVVVSFICLLLVLYLIYYRRKQRTYKIEQHDDLQACTYV